MFKREYQRAKELTGRVRFVDEKSMTIKTGTIVGTSFQENIMGGLFYYVEIGNNKVMKVPKACIDKINE